MFIELLIILLSYVYICLIYLLCFHIRLLVFYRLVFVIRNSIIIIRILLERNPVSSLGVWRVQFVSSVSGIYIYAITFQLKVMHHASKD